MNGRHINNGVGDNGGLLLARKGPQKFHIKLHSTSDCGNVVDAGTFAADVTTATAVNCQTASTTSLGGSGTFVWTLPAGMGTSVANVQVRWTDNKTLHYQGSVSATGSTTNVFVGQHVSGNLHTVQSLAGTATPGGSCSATIPLDHFVISAANIHIG